MQEQHDGHRRHRDAHAEVLANAIGNRLAGDGSESPGHLDEEDHEQRAEGERPQKLEAERRSCLRCGHEIADVEKPTDGRQNSQGQLQEFLHGLALRARSLRSLSVSEAALSQARLPCISAAAASRSERSSSSFGSAARISRFPSRSISDATWIFSTFDADLFSSADASSIAFSAKPIGVLFCAVVRPISATAASQEDDRSSSSASFNDFGLHPAATTKRTHARRRMERPLRQWLCRVWKVGEMGSWIANSPTHQLTNSPTPEL